MNHCRTSAAAPAVAGVEWLVPLEAVYHCCPPVGKKFDVPGPAHTPVASNAAAAPPLTLTEGSNWLACHTPPLTCVPGATISGFLRPSDVGPRDEKEMMSLALSAPVSAMPH